MPESTHLVLFEHDRLTIGHRYMCTGGGSFLFDARHFDALSRFGARATCKPFTLGHRSVCFRGFVGTLSVGRLLIEILPKADRHGCGEGPHVWQATLALMLQEARSSRLEHLSHALFRIHRGSLLDIYIDRFLACVERLVHRGLVRRYRQIEGNQSSFRGRLRIAPHIARNCVHAERFFVEYTTYDEQHLLNRIMLAALQVVRDLPVAADLHGRCRRCLLAFPELERTRITDRDLEQIRLDRTTAHYGEALELARLLLRHYHPGMARGDLSVMAILVDMSRLFEDFLGQLCRRIELPGLRVVLQRSEPFWTPDHGATRHLRPDIVLHRPGFRPIVIDAKWKNLPAAGPSIEDVRQIFAYNQFLGASHSVLLYPHHGNNPATASGAFERHEHRLSTATLRLVADARIDRQFVVAQLHALVERVSVPSSAV
jgi:5-methylcytosine-specific restriction enzyme subunit McrC